MHRLSSDNIFLFFVDGGGAQPCLFRNLLQRLAASLIWTAIGAELYRAQIPSLALDDPLGSSLPSRRYLCTLRLFHSLSLLRCGVCFNPL